MQWAMLLQDLQPLSQYLVDIITHQIMARLIVAARFWSKEQGQGLFRTSKSHSKTLLWELPAAASTQTTKLEVCIEN